MKKFLIYLFAGFFLISIAAGCDSGSKSKSGPADTMDDYYSLEPATQPNPNRAAVQSGRTARVGIPDYLLAQVQTMSLEDVTATFMVHNDDRYIAEIVGSATGTSCQIRGLQLGSARIIITVGDKSATVIISVAPQQALYTLPAAEVVRLGNSEFYNAWWTSDRPDGLPNDYNSYNSEPTYQLAWKYRNKGQWHGASGEDCGIDMLAYFVDPTVSDRRGWVRTTYGFGGWHYDLNGQTDNMTEGIQIEGNVKLQLNPEFIYDNGVPYLQITHTLTNTGTVQLVNQKFGASADIMIFNQDDAALTYMPYGALMTNENTFGDIHYLPTLKLRLVCENVTGIDDVSTLWFGEYPGEREYVYEDKRESITAEDDLDTALNFSYQGIDLNPGESKKFTIRFTQVQ